MNERVRVTTQTNTKGLYTISVIEDIKRHKKFMWYFTMDQTNINQATGTRVQKVTRMPWGKH